MSTITDHNTLRASHDSALDVVSLLTQTDFIGVRAALVRALGNDAGRALVLTRIYFCADERNRSAILRDGGWWWRTTYETMMEETGLTLNSVRGAVRWLVDAGLIEAVKHRVGGLADHTTSYRLLKSTDDVLESTHQDVSESTDLPSIKKMKNVGTPKRTAHTIPADWAPTDAHQAKALERGIDVTAEAERFRLYHEAKGNRFIDWNKAFSLWIGRAFPQPAGRAETPTKRWADMTTEERKQIRPDYRELGYVDPRLGDHE